MSPPDVLAPDLLPDASAELAQRDPALPMLPMLLCDTVLSAWLSSRLGEPVVAQRRYLRYKRGTACVATVRLRAAGGEDLLPDRSAATEPSPGDRTVMVAHWSHAAGSKLAKTYDKAVPGSVLLVDAGAGVLVTTPAADRHLPALRRFEDPLRRAELLRGVLGAEPFGRPDLDCATLSYKPQRRWVGRVTAPDGSHGLVRAYRPADLDRVAEVWAHTRSLAASGLPVARLLGTHARLGLAGVEWVEGRQLRLGDDHGRLAALGASLAELHARPARLPELPLPERVRSLRQTAALGATLAPSLTSRLEQVTVRVAQLLRDLPPGARATLHGDLSADQVVLGPDGRLRLIDLDRARAGAAADDLGSLAATARLDGLDPGPLLAEVSSGYADHAAPPGRAELAAYTAAQLLARATDGFRTAQVDWGTRLGRAVDSAEALL